MENEFLKPIKKSAKRWYLPVITGVILILIALWTFGNPAKSYVGLSLLFSISFFVSGVLEIIFSISHKRQLDNSLVLGIITLIIGILLLLNPEISMIGLALYIGFLILFRSFGAIGIVLDLKSYGESNWGALLVLGILGVLFSFILIWNPILGGLSIVIWTGITLFTGGFFSLLIGFKMRKVYKNWGKISNEIKSQYVDLENRIKDELKR